MPGLADSIVITEWEIPEVEHAVNRAIINMNGGWDATSDESRVDLLRLVREEGFPRAEMIYDPAEGKVPRVRILPGAFLGAVRPIRTCPAPVL